MKTSIYKVPGGKMLKIRLDSKDRKITHVQILGDFFLHPEEAISKIENSLLGCVVEKSIIASTITRAISEENATLLGVTPEDIALAIVIASET